MKIQQGISYSMNQLRVGSSLKVIIDRMEGDYYTGRSEYDSPEVDHEILIPAEYKLETGSFYNIKITSAEEFDLFGVPSAKTTNPF